MGDKVTLSPLTVEDNSSYESGLNSRLDELADEFDNVLYRDGSTDLSGALNANSKRIYNLPAPVGANDAARLADVQDAIAGTPNLSLLTYTSSYTGGVERNLQAWLTDYVSVRDFIPVALHDGIDAGTDTTDLTDYFQAASNTGKNVFVPNGNYWLDPEITGAWRALSNQRITFEAGAVLNALPNDDNISAVLYVFEVENVVIEGPGTIVGERATHTGPSSNEAGSGIDVRNSTRITIRDLNIRDCNGDGIAVGGRENLPTNPGATASCYDVTIENVNTDNNRRNGVAITACDGFKILLGTYTNSNGVTGAQCGIDLEPNNGKAPVKNGLVVGPICTGNTGPGIAMALPTCSDIRVVAPDCRDNTGDGIRMGYVTRINLVSPDCRGNGAYGIFAFGQGVTSTWATGVHITNPQVHDNGIDGICFDDNVDGFSVIGGEVSLNGQHGILIGNAATTYPCQNGVVGSVFIHSNSQTAHGTYRNMRVNSPATHIRVLGSNFKQGSQANKPVEGLRVSSNNVVFVAGNDFTNGGVTSGATGMSNPNNTWRDNIGYLNDNDGTISTSTNASGDVVVAHGLGTTPNIAMVRPTGTTLRHASVVTKDATNLTIRFFDAAGAALASTAVTADWEAKV